MNIKFDEKGLIPAVVQDATSKEVLTVAYMNEESLQKTIETKETWFYSRSRQELWHKGATSGNTQKVVDIRFDCDQDALVVLVVPAGPACHTGSYSCFSDSLLEEEVANTDNRYEILNLLEATIAQREAERPEGSYTTYLFEKGIDKMLKKIGEEAGEVIIAAKNRDPEELRWEIADLLFHLLVVMREQNLSLDTVLDTLKERHAK
ncbi:bifunctional phosphoribosyl-AMP cyclohydrolase/phosphoribosyl-ATP diphosphatase HisIE [Anaerobacillus alkaliphilus]|uniref:Histidine biosynthesis bifunctional protein HisIE n=1 Tax=Anaerobacillus alkaliphilus TaxID=1548597 RepID=A0A4Q0VT60_9BACI|nr:bifunctional phosphoribosyl-AMP cyclohydrolase/phosphoribosyl-ATP diphosphatase HisIE [Anaerobacillus alkaliphilus]RXJ01736.1 bifunctional phosphoribosyl-AMP cyclohydrolase/phosphoribosyl-ATP diphosphatase HisIE [Anaerobacillus alkaliphilus]